jgi:hypothetical protein
MKMIKELAKWELGMLLNMKFELEKIARNNDCNNDNRITVLRNFLDSINEEKPEIKLDSEMQF